ncbi:unnamed protein product [Trypanosoma congolense IL3000]|uniref:WGS project CAEQ00000000 data, annotated contig 1611 n=1 Tax=Trypanosoma congolense (strain IL3000) TaxID=1068625 RepID=F9W7H0_TRYCI|nr:unnamed protein product [Trypanosoma congolense IL3000]
MNCPLLALIVFSHCSSPTARSLYRICIPILITDIVCVCVFPNSLFPLFLSFVVWCVWESSEDNQRSGGRLTYPLTATATRIAAWRVVSKLFAKRIVALLFLLFYSFRYFLLLFSLISLSLFHGACATRAVAMTRHALTFQGLSPSWWPELTLACTIVTFTHCFCLH